jgi:TRAP-type C4-dicarboxylate transport system substrate-binding protein
MTRLFRQSCSAIPIALLLGFVPAGDVKAQTINWQVGHVLPAAHWTVDQQIKMAAKWSEATKGRLKLNILPSESSGVKGPDMLSAAGENLLQMSDAYGSNVAGQERVLELFDLPFFVPFDVDFRARLWAALFDDFAQLLDRKHGVWLLGYNQLEPRQLYTKKPVRSTADFRGLKIRAIGPVDSDFTRSLGAAATTTNFGELYTTIQQGTNDGTWVADSGALAMKFYEVAPYMYETNNAGPTVFTVISKKAIAALPDDVRNYVMSQREEYAKDRLNRLKGAVSALRQILLKQGVKVTDVGPADEAKMLELANPVIEKWAANLPAANRPLYEKAKKIIADYKAAKK